jgi:hypothetical protein
MNNTAIGTTSIDSLPMAPTQTATYNADTYTPENIRLEMNNVKVDNPAQTLQQNRDNDPAVAQKNMNQFITGIQQASAAGYTALPARDIPQNQHTLTQDQEIQPNFIPQPLQPNNDYIANHISGNDIVRENMRRQESNDSLDNVYNELQIPILIGVLFFLFQLPIVRKSLFKYLPTLFHTDGNLNLGGYISNSVLFGLAYYIVNKFIIHFSL